MGTRFFGFGRNSVHTVLLAGIVTLATACNQTNQRETEGLSVQSGGSSGSSSSGSGSGSSTSSGSTGNAGGAAVTCALTLTINGGVPSMGNPAINANVGDQSAFNVTTSATGSRLHWFGTKDGTPDLDAINPPPFNGPFQDVSGGHIFTRYVVVENSAGTALCSTKTANGGQPMTVIIPPGPTCSLTMALNGGAASKGNPTISANVGDAADFTVATTATGYNLHWYGTKDGVSDTDVVQNNPNFFDGPFADTAGGHTYTRYVVVEKATTGAPLCSTKTANGGQPMSVAIAAGPTCQLNLGINNGTSSKGPNLNANVGDLSTWSVTTSATAYHLHWRGTKDGVADLDVVNDNPSSFDGFFQPSSGGHIFTRYVVVEKPSTNAPLCSTKTVLGGVPMTVTIAAGPTCSLSLSLNGGAASMGANTINAKVNDQSVWKVPTNATGFQYHWFGTKDGNADLDAIATQEDAFDGPLPNDASGSTFTRYVIIEKTGTNAPLCDTRTANATKPLSLKISP